MVGLRPHIISMYKALRGGGTTGKSGMYWRFTAGQTIPAGKGELDHSQSVIWIGRKIKKKRRETIHPKPFNGTIPDIKEWLDKHGVDYKSTARKAELLEILEDA